MAQRVQVLVELAHIYKDEIYGKEQEKSFRILEALGSSLGDDIGTCVLVDDINVTGDVWDDSYLIELFEDKRVDFIYSEKSLCSIADELIGSIPNVSVERFGKLNKNVWVYDDGTHRFGLREQVDGFENRDYCVLLSFCWTLCKLGLFDYVDSGLMDGDVLTGDSLLTILPERFRDVESNVTVMLGSMFGEYEVNRLSYCYY